MKGIKITIITVCYNSKDLLSLTLNSVALQDYDDLEYIIIDGKSTDGTLELIESYGNKVSRCLSEHDKGIYDAMNKGVSLSTGDWLLFLNAGDRFASNDVLERIFSHNITGDVIYGDVIKDGKIKKAELPHNSHRMFFCHQSCLVRRQLLLKYPFDIEYKLSADFKFIKTLYNIGMKFIKLDFPISIFDTTGISNSKRSVGLWDNIKVIHEVDNLYNQIRLLPRLFFVFLLCKLRGK